MSDRIEEGCLPDAIRVVHRGTFRGALILIVVLLPCSNFCDAVITLLCFNKIFKLYPGQCSTSQSQGWQGGGGVWLRKPGTGEIHRFMLAIFFKVVENFIDAWCKTDTSVLVSFRPKWNRASDAGVSKDFRFTWKNNNQNTKCNDNTNDDGLREDFL